MVLDPLLSLRGVGRGKLLLLLQEGEEGRSLLGRIVDQVKVRGVLLHRNLSLAQIR